MLKFDTSNNNILTIGGSPITINGSVAARLDIENLFTVPQFISLNTPQLWLNVANAAADERAWFVGANLDGLTIGASTDDALSLDYGVVITRGSPGGDTIRTIQLKASTQITTTGPTVVDGNLTITGTVVNMVSATLQVGAEVVLGGVFAIYNSGLTDNATFTHDGTDFNTTFANTADWNLSGAKLISAATTSGQAGFNLPHGTAPSAPADGDLWSTSGGMFTRVNGTTQTFPPVTTGSFTGTITGVSSGGTGTINWYRVGNLVTLYAAAPVVGASNTTSMTMTGVDAAVQTTNDKRTTCPLVNSSGQYGGAAVLGGGTGTITFYINYEPTSGSPETIQLSAIQFSAAGGNKGVDEGWSFTYVAD